jgi:hypothetical protein
VKGVIHQPHFCPWLGYFNKLANCDIFIVQDNVQYRERYFQNRTLIRNSNNKCLWLTLPVNHNRSTLIQNIAVANKYWKVKLINDIFWNYRGEKYFDLFYYEICMEIFQSPDDLVSINTNLIKYFLSVFDIDISIIKASDFQKSESATENLVNLCKLNDINYYIFGEGGGLGYHGVNSFKVKGIKTFKQVFLENHKLQELYFHNGVFNLSVLDYVFKMDLNEVKRIVKRKNVLPV